MPRLEAPDATYPIMKHRFKWAIIDQLYTRDDTADITIIDKDYNRTDERYSGVPIFYHCQPDSEKRDNGALEGASKAFAENDKVIVRFEDGSPLVIARMDGLKECRSGSLAVATNTGEMYIIEFTRGGGLNCKPVTKHPMKELFKEQSQWQQILFKIGDKTFSLITQEYRKIETTVNNKGYEKCRYIIYNHDNDTYQILAEVPAYLMVFTDNSANSSEEISNFYTIKYTEDYRRIAIVYVRYEKVISGKGINRITVHTWIYDYDEAESIYRLHDEFEDSISDVRDDSGTLLKSLPEGFKEGSGKTMFLISNDYDFKRGISTGGCGDLLHSVLLPLDPDKGKRGYCAVPFYNIFTRTFYIEQGEWTGTEFVQGRWTKQPLYVDIIDVWNYRGEIFVAYRKDYNYFEHSSVLSCNGWDSAKRDQVFISKHAGDFFVDLSKYVQSTGNITYTTDTGEYIGDSDQPHALPQYQVATCFSVCECWEQAFQQMWDGGGWDDCEYYNEYLTAGHCVYTDTANKYKFDYWWNEVNEYDLSFSGAGKLSRKTTSKDPIKLKGVNRATQSIVEDVNIYSMSVENVENTILDKTTPETVRELDFILSIIDERDSNDNLIHIYQDEITPQQEGTLPTVDITDMICQCLFGSRVEGAKRINYFFFIEPIEF